MREKAYAVQWHTRKAHPKSDIPLIAPHRYEIVVFPSKGERERAHWKNGAKLTNLTEEEAARYAGGKEFLREENLTMYNGILTVEERGNPILTEDEKRRLDADIAKFERDQMLWDEKHGIR